ncbi:MAG: response regulator transcription factor [Candidatus Peregrinibacteria bacterium]|nr:response regulator transcription factor [Candidatus Peregrinibacteria bacterium]
MKILLIEDEIELANFLMRGFKYEGYRVDHLMDGEGMADYLTRNKWDVIILDLILPSKSGESILKEMRMRKDTTPVIVLTAIDDIETKTKILNLGADDYLVKPFSFVELVARIKSILRRSASSQKTTELVVGDLTLNPDMRMVRRGSKSIKLRLKEYVLLEYFMQNPNKVINRNTLIESVWDYNARLLSNTVDSHISLLRKKINEDFDDKLIETIHGIGYILRSKGD